MDISFIVTSFIGESVNSVGIIGSQLVKLLANALTNELTLTGVTHGGYGRSV